jgi:drug/metabolite transporter (DMT)-like permease
VDGGHRRWNAGIRRLGSSGAMVSYNTLPLYGALLGHLFLGESVGPAHLLGGALIIGGGLWAALGRTTQKARSGSPDPLPSCWIWRSSRSKSGSTETKG